MSEQRIEIVISQYIDALNAGDDPPVEAFLAKFPYLSPLTVASLTSALKMLRRIPKWKRPDYYDSPDNNAWSRANYGKEEGE